MVRRGPRGCAPGGRTIVRTLVESAGTEKSADRSGRREPPRPKGQNEGRGQRRGEGAAQNPYACEIEARRRREGEVRDEDRHRESNPGHDRSAIEVPPPGPFGQLT